MQLSVTLVTVFVLVAVVWILMETRKFRHKIVEVVLIFMILFAYFSFTFVMNGKGVNLSTVDGIKQAGSIYLSWLGSVFSNLKTLTTNAIHMNWGISHSVSSNISVVNVTNVS